MPLFRGVCVPSNSNFQRARVRASAHACVRVRARALLRAHVGVSAHVRVRACEGEHPVCAHACVRVRECGVRVCARSVRVHVRALARARARVCESARACLRWVERGGGGEPGHLGAAGSMDWGEGLEGVREKGGEGARQPQRQQHRPVRLVAARPKARAPTLSA